MPPQPPQVFSLRGLRLYFAVLEPWVTWSATLPAVLPGVWGCGVLPAALPALFSATLSPALSVYLCANVGLQGLLVVRLPAPFVPHSTSLGPSTATRVLSAPAAVSTLSTGLDECLFFIFLVSDFLAVRFSVSSGCVRRRSVSTYAAILVLAPLGAFSKLFQKASA